jgi:hypothetical protein
MKKFSTLANVRFNKRELDHTIKQFKLEKPHVTKIGASYFVKMCEADTDPLPGMIEALRQQVKLANRERQLKDRKHYASHGVCARVRAWTAKNPTATVRDALAAFPNCNKITVRIQFAKERNG